MKDDAIEDGERRRASESDPHDAHRRATTGFARALIAGLWECGVQHVVVSPGSRSTPLALAAHRQPGLSLTVHHDERSAAFLALGLAKTTDLPVVLVCTSGSAAANYLPAVVEAFYACVPLIVLSADRPPELRGWGAGQTIEQHGLFGAHARHFAELPVPSEGIDGTRIARSEARRAVVRAQGRPAGPVHLNCPFREPLEPPLAALPEAGGGDGTRAPARCALSPRVASHTSDDVDELVRCVRANPRGLIACGPLGRETQWPDALLRFAELSGWPILADPLSQLRRGPWNPGAAILASADLWLRDARFARAHASDAVLRIGATPTSKAFRLWLEARPPRELLLLDPDALWNDPSRLASAWLPVEPGPLLAAAAERLAEEPPVDAVRDQWRSSFTAAEAAARQVLRDEFADSRDFLEPELTATLGELLPANALLCVASSMAIRDVDAFLNAHPQPLRILANRGANGIDGTLSTAFGAALAHDGPVVLLSGDLAFLHDLGGLAVAKRLGIDATLVVMNNDGGGIFSFLPIAARSAQVGESEHFETLFHTPHGIDLAGCAALFGVGFERAAGREAFAKALEHSLASPGVQVIEVPIERDANVARFRSLVHEVGDAVAEALALRDGEAR